MEKSLIHWASGYLSWQKVCEVGPVGQHLLEGDVAKVDVAQPWDGHPKW